MGPAHIRIAAGRQEKRRSRTIDHKRKVWLQAQTARETCKMTVHKAYIKRLKTGTHKVRCFNLCLPIFFNSWWTDSKEQYFLLSWLCQQSPNPHRQQHAYSWCICSEIVSQFIQLLECLAWMLWMVGATSYICICLFFKSIVSYCGSQTNLHQWSKKAKCWLFYPVQALSNPIQEWLVSIQLKPAIS